MSFGLNTYESLTQDSHPLFVYQGSSPAFPGRALWESLVSDLLQEHCCNWEDRDYKRTGSAPIFQGFSYASPSSGILQNSLSASARCTGWRWCSGHTPATSGRGNGFQQVHFTSTASVCYMHLIPDAVRGKRIDTTAGYTIFKAARVSLKSE